MTKTEFQMYIHGKIAIEDDEKYIRPARFKRDEEDGYTYTYYGVEFDVEDVHICVYPKTVDDCRFVAEINGSIVAKARTVHDMLVEVHKHLYGHDNYTEYLH